MGNHEEVWDVVETEACGLDEFLAYVEEFDGTMQNVNSQNAGEKVWKYIKEEL